MSAEDAFLRGLLATPGDAALRSVYADWLEERGDSRAELVRLDPALGRIHYADWLGSDGSLAYSSQQFPDVKRVPKRRLPTERVRRRLSALLPAIDPAWLAFLNTLANPFRPLCLFNPDGYTSELTLFKGQGELPFTEQVGTRGVVMTFEPAFQDGSRWGPGLVRDLGFLYQLRLGECYCGAGTFPVHPFLCELQAAGRTLTAADVLAALNPRAFRSAHIQNLRARRIPYPGYHPHTENDEIHTDPTGQFIFPRPGDEGSGNEPSGCATHAALRGYVAGKKLWYVLLHGTPFEFRPGIWLRRFVVLFAVGKSPHGDRLVGVITHQICHNLCD